MMILRLRITFLPLVIAVAVFALQAAKVMAETL